MKENLILLIKGFIIGIGKIIPGVSGAMLSISLNVYDKAIESITHFFDDIKKNIKFLLFLGVGVVIAIIFFSNIIDFCLNNYYVITLLFFTGMIIGGIPPLFKNINKDKKNYLIMVISFLIIILLSISNIDNNYVIKNNITDLIIFFLGGILDAVGTVVPGISGTALLTILGIYNIIINCLSNITNISLLMTNISIIVPYTLGLGMGIIIVSLIISNLLKKYKTLTFSFIIGVSISTIILIFIKVLTFKFKVYELIIGLIFLLVGILISTILDKK